MEKRKHPAVIRYPDFKRKEKNYYRSKLMLFIPWRNEVDDMYGHFNSYKEHFVAERQVIRENEGKYVKNGKKLDEAIEDMQRAYQNGVVENAWDEVAPCAVAEDCECELEGPEDVNVFDEQLPLFEERMHNRPSNADSRGQLRARFTTEANDRVLSDEVYEKQIECLNDEQKSAVMFNRQWCEAFANAVNNSLPRPAAYHLFVSGPGGVGKSHVISLVHTDCVKRLRRCRPHGEEMYAPDDICVLLTAPTGTAAFNIGGLTLHSALLLSQDNSKLSADKMNTLQTVLGKLTVLIIDEISMVGSDFLVQIDKRLRAIKRDDKPFGGVSVVAVGDLYQLPPVRQRPVFTVPRDPFYQLYGSVWQSNFSLIELTQNMRQKDSVFAEILNRIRVGVCTDSDGEVLCSRLLKCDKQHPEYPIDVMHIFGTNRECDDHNIYCLNKSENKVFTLTAVDSKLDKLTKTVKTVEIARDDDICGLRREVYVCVGARIMLVVNLDVSDGLVNGVIGTVKGIIQREETVVAIQVEFDNRNVGKKAAVTNQSMSHFPNCVSLARHCACSAYGKGNTVAVTRSQFPIRLAFACTIHKVQGMTLDRVVISMKSKFTHGQAYVALSRVKTLQGLHLLDFNKKKIIHKKEVAQEMNRLQRKKISVTEE